MSESEILEDYPELERDDFRAVYEYAARFATARSSPRDPIRH